MALTAEERDFEVAAALADSCYARDSVHLIALPNLDGTEHVGAVWYPPGLEIEVDDRHLRDAALRAAANDRRVIGLHRIAVPALPTSRIMFAALLRHELEHARQWDALGVGLFDLQDFLEADVLPEVAGGLDGCAGTLINSVPTEIDCNAAASIYISSRFPEEQLAELRDGPRRFLACSLIAPAPRETLVRRMIAFAYIYCAAVEAHALRRGFSVHSILRTVHPRAPEIWAAIADDETNG
jgi:hypothetical protein